MAHYKGFKIIKLSTRLFAKSGKWVNQNIHPFQGNNRIKGFKMLNNKVLKVIR